MKKISRLARVQTVTCPDTGRVYPIPAGGSDDGGQGDGSGEGGGDPSGAAGGEGAGGGEGDGGGQPSPLEQQAMDAIDALKKTGAEIPEALSAVVKEFRDARKEAGNHRAAKSAEKDRADAAEQRLADVLKALGVDTDDDPDPDALKQAIDAKDAQLRARDVELAAYRAAMKQGANPDALLDSRQFLDTVSKLDPADEKFSASLEDAIKQAVENNPLLAASPGGGRGPMQGPTPTPNQRPTSLGEAVAARYQ